MRYCHGTDCNQLYYATYHDTQQCHYDELNTILFLNSLYSRSYYLICACVISISLPLNLPLSYPPFLPPYHPLHHTTLHCRGDLKLEDCTHILVMSPSWAVAWDIMVAEEDDADVAGTGIV